MDRLTTTRRCAAQPTSCASHWAESSARHQSARIEGLADLPWRPGYTPTSNTLNPTWKRPRIIGLFIDEGLEFRSQRFSRFRIIFVGSKTGKVSEADFLLGSHVRRAGPAIKIDGPEVRCFAELAQYAYPKRKATDISLNGITEQQPKIVIEYIGGTAAPEEIAAHEPPNRH